MKTFLEDRRNKYGHQLDVDVDAPPERPFVQKPKKPVVWKDVDRPKNEAAEPNVKKEVQQTSSKTDNKSEAKKEKQAAVAKKVMDIVKGKKNKISIEPVVDVNVGHRTAVTFGDKHA